jgi:hypothetical protein
MAKANTARRVPAYKGESYWERETPRTATTGKLILSYFPNAGKLQISQAYQDRETGETRRGRTVTLDVEDVALHLAAREMLADFLAAAE